MKNLTKKQQQFVRHFILSQDPEESARLAGYTMRTAWEQKAVSTLLLQNDMIKQAIKESASSRGASPDLVIMRLTEQAFGSIESFLDEDIDGQLILDLNKAKKNGKLSLVKSIKTDDKGRIVHLELHDSQQALDKLAKIFQLYVQKIEVYNWEDKAIEMIKRQEIDFIAAADTFGADVAKQLFSKAGILMIEGKNETD